MDGEQEGKASSPVHTGTEWGQHLEDTVSREAGQRGDSTQGRSREFAQGWTLPTATDMESPRAPDCWRRSARLVRASALQTEVTCHFQTKALNC